jgi:hypothetical protein
MFIRKKHKKSAPQEDGFKASRESSKRRFNEIVQPIFLNQSQIRNATLFSKREDAFQLIPKSPRILEIGVLAGDYSAKIIDFLSGDIKRYLMVDLFNQPDWFNSDSPRFDWDGNLSFVKNRFEKHKFVDIIQGDSRLILSGIQDEFDYIYIDADHSYEYVAWELEVSSNLCSESGIIGLNDYIMQDYFTNEPYGVVQAVNEFLDKNHNWEVVGFSFNGGLFSDIYLSKLKSRA